MENVFQGIIDSVEQPENGDSFRQCLCRIFADDNPRVWLSARLCSSATAWDFLVSRLLGSGKSQQLYAKFQKTISRIGSGFMGLMGLKLISAD